MPQSSSSSSSSKPRSLYWSATLCAVSRSSAASGIAADLGRKNVGIVLPAVEASAAEAARAASSLAVSASTSASSASGDGRAGVDPGPVGFPPRAGGKEPARSAAHGASASASRESFGEAIAGARAQLVCHRVRRNRGGTRAERKNGSSGFETKSTILELQKLATAFPHGENTSLFCIPKFYTGVVRYNTITYTAADAAHLSSRRAIDGTVAERTPSRPALTRSSCASRTSSALRVVLRTPRLLLARLPPRPRSQWRAPTPSRTSRGPSRSS